MPILGGYDLGLEGIEASDLINALAGNEPRIVANTFRRGPLTPYARRRLTHPRGDLDRDVLRDLLRTLSQQGAIGPWEHFNMGLAQDVNRE